VNYKALRVTSSLVSGTSTSDSSSTVLLGVYVQEVDWFHFETHAASQLLEYTLKK